MIAIGLGIMVSVKGSGEKEMIEVDRHWRGGRAGRMSGLRLARGAWSVRDAEPEAAAGAVRKPPPGMGGCC